MHEPRTPAGLRRPGSLVAGAGGGGIIGGIPLLPRSSGSIAPDHPPKQMQAWVSECESISWGAFGRHECEWTTPCA